jgi:hypothetical protein
VFGAAFEPLQGLWISADLERMEHRPLSAKSGIEFSVADNFSLRGGVQSSPVRFAGGFGVKAGAVRMDYSYRQHANLSGSHEFDLTFRFGSKTEKGKIP